MSKALKAAIEANDEEAVRKALKAVKDVNRQSHGAGKPLLFACKVGADRALDALFRAGAVAEKLNTFPGDTPFAVAAEHRQFGVMKRLLELKQASESAIEHVLQNACMDGQAAVLEFVLRDLKPPVTIELFRLSFVASIAPEMVKLLVKYGGDIRARHDTNEAKQATVLHEAAGHGKPELIKALIECGAEVNARDSLGRTPLMVLAADLEGIDVQNERVPGLLKLLASGTATLLAGQPPKEVDGLNELKTFLTLGADASLRDKFGNDAIDYCIFEYHRSNRTPPREYTETLREAGAKGSQATIELFTALRKKNVAAMRAAIRKGGDVNRVTPPPVRTSALGWVAGGESEEMVQVLLEAGANPNRVDSGEIPLICAARCGRLANVKRLLAAGADLHALEQDCEYPDNAYSAAKGNQKHEVADYLKSLGAGNPKPAKAEPLEPGVGSWNDFSEILVKASANDAARALAKMIKGRAELEAYGKEFLPRKRAYVVAQPLGMQWSNIIQIAPLPLRFEDEKKIAFAADLAKAAGAPVLSIQYSGTSDAASIVRFSPEGKRSEEHGCDRKMLQEMVEAMGDEAPAWAKRQLAKTPEDDPSSTERLTMLAEQEKFVVASFGLYCEPGSKLEVEFHEYGPEAFEGVAFVSN
jgi:ankyrin repeat protein